MTPENIKNTIQAIADGLTPLAQKLGVAVEGLWTWGMQHNYAVAFQNVFGAFIGLLLIIPAVYLFKVARKEPKERYGEVTGLAAFCFLFSTIMFLAGIIVFVACSMNAIDRFVAPEWNTAKDVSCLIKDCSSN